MAVAGGALLAIDAAILAVFVAELLVKLAVYRLSFFRSGWNIFDLVVVGIALVPSAGPLAVLRALRILRVLRLLSVVGSMRRVVQALLDSLPGMGSVGAVLLLVFYVSAVLTTKLFGEPVQRVEDLKLITGTAHFLDDLGHDALGVAFVAGTLVLSEVFLQLEKHARAETSEPLMPPSGDPGDQNLTREDLRYAFPVILRSTGIGAIIGLLPGLGSAVACFIAYGEEKRRAKRPHLWGRGAPEGIAAPEAANNAVSGPSMVPVLTLGIPGSTIAAMLMGVFLIHGIQVGPTIFIQSKDLIYSLFAAGLIGILTYGVIGWFAGPLIGRVIGAVPQRLIYPTIFILTLVATYSLRNELFDLYVTLAFGVIGYFLRRGGFSAPAFIIAFVLSVGAEQTLRQTLLMSNDGWAIFAERPAAMFFLVLGFAVLIWRSVQGLRQQNAATSSA